MARNYGIIVPGFWDNAVLRRLPEDCTPLLAYILTCPASTAAGTFILKLSDMTDHLRWPEQRVRSALNELHRKPFVLWDADTRVLHLPGWYTHNPISNHKVAIHIARLCLALPNCELKQKAVSALRAQGRFLETINTELGDWKWDGVGGQLSLLGPAPTPTKTVEATKPPVDKSAKGTRLSPDWQPDAEMVQWALDQGLTRVVVEQQAEKFLAYYLSDNAKNPVKKNWYQGWQTWIRNFLERSPVRANGTNGHANGSNGSHAVTEINGIKVSGDTAFYREGAGDAKWIPRATGWNERKFWLASWGPEPGQRGCKCPAELLTPAVE